MYIIVTYGDLTKRDVLQSSEAPRGSAEPHRGHPVAGARRLNDGSK